MADVIEPIAHDVEVPLGVEEAFSFFTEWFHAWWPREYSWSQDSLVSIGIEPRTGGRCTELGPNNFQCDWGQVLAYRPPDKLTISWQISARREPQPDPRNASVVDVTFSELGASRTLVRLKHSDLQKHGEGAQAYREALDSEWGWPFILGRFKLGACAAETF